MTRRFTWLILALAAFVTLTSIYMYFWPMNKLLISPVPLRYDKKFDQTLEIGRCKIPKISPWHKSILPLIQHPKEVECRAIQPEFTYLDEYGILHLNTETVKTFQWKELKRKKLDKPPDVDCQYAYFDRGRLDKEINFEPELPLVKAIRIERNFVRVMCNASYEIHGERSTEFVYANLHAHPVEGTAKRGSFNFATSDNMNVFLFFLESASASAFRRNLPLSFRYLNAEMGAFIFDSFLKVGENTLPNLAALFTGLRLRNEQPNMKPELKQASTNDGFFDHWPLIWKQFAEAGYITTYMEDYTHLSTFHYSGNGFRQKPVDYWYFPFWETLRLIELPKKSSKFCFGNVPIYQIFNDILSRHLMSNEWIEEKQFLFALFNDLSHDYACDLQRADSDWRDFFQHLHERNRLNRTLLIIAGDHGPRFTSIRPTEAGFVEERVPFLSLWLPDWFLKKHSKVRENLKLNQHRLTSIFDLRQTLVDILENRFIDQGTDSDREKIKPGARGISLFRELPLNRTCFAVGVPDRYCLCEGITIEPIDHPLADRSSALVLSAVRNVTKRFRTRCVKLKVENIVYFIKQGSRDDDFLKTYFVAVRTHPSNAIFEGAVLYNSSDGTMNFKTGTLERITMFKGRTHCVSTLQLKKFCICKDDALANRSRTLK